MAGNKNNPKTDDGTVGERIVRGLKQFVEQLQAGKIKLPKRCRIRKKE